MRLSYASAYWTLSVRVVCIQAMRFKANVLQHGSAEPLSFLCNSQLLQYMNADVCMQLMGELSAVI